LFPQPPLDATSHPDRRVTTRRVSRHARDAAGDGSTAIPSRRSSDFVAERLHDTPAVHDDVASDRALRWTVHGL
jgi:hypothetical protein